MGVVADFRILGPLEVRLKDGEVVRLGGLRQRAVLAVLVLHANEVVSTDQLIDLLWGEHPPTTALHTIQVFVARLRRALASAGDRLITRPPGYVLQVDADEIDAGRCEHLSERARAASDAGDPARAAALLRNAAALWRGPPLAEFTYEPFAQPAIARLEELRARCREDLIEAELALGHHATVLSDLEALVREHPLRERPRGQLMLALYRSGRQADALDAYQQARHMLVEELGVEPSIALKELQQAILRQDSSLEVPSSTPANVQPPEPESLALDLKGPSSSASVHEAATPEQRHEALVRKIVTVLMARFVERGAPGRTDPERARDLVSRAREQAQRILSHHGGTCVFGLAGEIVGIFGLPLTKEDDPLRALRAADELRRVGLLSADQHSDMEVRVAVDTGEVVGESPSDLYGPPLTGAATLLQAAEDADVLVSDATRSLTLAAARVEPAPGGDAWRLLAVVREPLFHGRRAVPMVGRERELLTARNAFERAARDGAQVLTVIGDAGIGKSRLVQELTEQLHDQAVILTGHCLSYGEGVAFWPLREALVQAAGNESRDAIHELLGDATDAELVADIVAGTLGGRGAERSSEQVPWAFRRLLEELARRRPVVLVIEDAHWAETALLELVDYLIDWLTAPVLLLCTARPELLDVRPQWGGGHMRVSSMVLVSLSNADALRLLDHHLGETHLSAAETAQILQTAEGNPLFVEQLLAMTVHDPRQGRDRPIPVNIQSLLAARLDRLGPGERAVIQRAAVIGRQFWSSAIVELLPPDARASKERHLRALIRRGLIEPDRSAMAGEEALRFQHILIRDVAYLNTPKAIRSELHECFAQWLAQRGGYEEFVGYHLERAFHYNRELGRFDAEVWALAVRAGRYLAAAGRRALSRGDAGAGIKLLRTSAELFEAGGTSRPDVLLDLGSAVRERGEFVEAQRIFEVALEQAQTTHSEASAARATIELSYQRVLVDRRARVREMLEVAERAMTVFKRIGDEAGMARAWQYIGEVHWTRCRCAEMEKVLDRALRHAERAGQVQERSRILTDLASATVAGPRPVADGISRCNAILERAADDVRLTAVTGTMLAVLEAMEGRFDAARDRWNRSNQQLENVGLSVTATLLQMYSAFIELLAGTPENAQPGLVSAYTLLEQIGDRHRLATIAALLARLLYARGNYDEAERYSRIGMETGSSDDVSSQVLWRSTRAKVLVRTDERRADELADSAVALARKTDFLMLHADALSDRAEVSMILHRPPDAAEDLEHAIALYQRKGATVAVDATRRVYESIVPPSVDRGADPVDRAPRRRSQTTQP